MCEVPNDEIIQHFKPQKKIANLRINKPKNVFEKKALKFATDLKQIANIPWSSIGVSGSILAGLTTKTSDIDLIIYGEENARKAYATMQQMFKEDHSSCRAYTDEELGVLYDFRSKDTHMSFEDFKKNKKRKAFQGMYQGTDFFVRFIKDWHEISEQYGDVYYNNAGYAKIAAKISSKEQALFTPCIYQIENVELIKGPNLAPIHEVSSFRGRFCEQAENGENIVAQGKMEEVVEKKNDKKYYRLLLGSNPQDYMILGTV
jgi:predicted nucleotidyltransferase